MRAVIESIEGEYRRYRALGEGTLDQLDRVQLCARPTPGSLSVATIVWHISGNLESRFTDFLTTDGEKPWRQREEEFAERDVGPEEVRAKWERGWHVLTATLASLEDRHLDDAVTIRGVDFTVSQALHRSLGHTAYHVGQMTYLGKMHAGDGWTYLSIAPGGTSAYNANPTHEKM
ncbi:MAG: DUF1572 domain-containing protein [Gemmatimonadota bacterium]|nr:DUF1572 domain-containing protein [Gemmatimonadota bacterium]MDH3424519.1 DUF1572 domain-containing protein [Gemmatimonadota bacterium]